MKSFYYLVILGLPGVGSPGLAGAGEPGERAAATPLIRLANSQMEMAFDPQTGALQSLRNRTTGDEYLKEPGGDGNPFRGYLDPTELPPAVTRPGHVLAGTGTSSLGSRLVDPRECRLLDAPREQRGPVQQLTLRMEHPTTGLQFVFQVRLPEQEEAADWSLMVRNGGHQTHTLMMAFPYLTGLGLGDSRETNRGAHPVAGVPAWENYGGSYGKQVLMPWQAVYEPSRNEGLGLVVLDPALESKVLERFPPAGMAVLYYPARMLAPGQQVRFPPVRVLVHEGNWRVVARRYGAWFRRTFSPRPTPAWLDQVDLFFGDWMPSPEAVAQAQARPEGPGRVASFRDLPRLYLPGFFDLKEWAMYPQEILSPKKEGQPWYEKSQTDPQPRLDLGGVKALREGIAEVHRRGRYATLYVAGVSRLRTSSLFWGHGAETWAQMDQPGHMASLIPDGDYVSMCPGYEPWQDYLAELCKQLVWQTGVDGIRLDELGVPMPCYNPRHHHKNPFAGNQWVRQLLRRVRMALDEVNPQATLWTEHPMDYFHQYCDAALAMMPPGRDLAPLSAALPRYRQFAYHPGQVECALNGWGGGKLRAVRPYWLEWWIVQKPEDAPTEPGDWAEGVGPRLRWHELRPTFLDAWRTGEVALHDPVAPDNPRWVGRLWRTRKYAVLVGGHEYAFPLSGPTRVQLPALPESVTSAYEIDAATLELRPTPLIRGLEGPQVTVQSGWSAVLLPRPECPPLVLGAEALPSLQPGEKGEVALRPFAPWRPETNPRVHISLPGLEVKPAEIALPGRVQVHIPADAEPGFYPLRVRGECLPLKRWLEVKPRL